MADGRVTFEILGDSKPFSKSVSGAKDLAKNTAVDIGKAFTAATAAAAAGIVALAGNSIKSFAEYEQLVGGVDTLFKGNADTVKAYAENAFKTSGLSANEYMATVTSFSSSLIQSLGGDTEKAAEYADMAITDMADNVNRFGSDMESVQNAYTGFSKQNFTMLDNLKLGYAGTKEEMQRLLDDATKISGIEYDISSYSDIAAAIHVIQEEMGVAGTTAAEAESTIQGSFNSMKAAAENLVTGLADENADLGQLAQNLIDSFVVFAGNMVPRIQTLLPRITEGITMLVNNLAPQIAPILSSILPAVLSGAIEIVSALSQTLPEIIKVLQSLLPDIIDVITNELFPTIFDVLISTAPLLIETAFSLFSSLVSALSKTIPVIVAKIPELILALVDALLSPESLNSIIIAGGELFLALIENLPEIIINLLKAVPVIIKSIIDALLSATPQFVKVGEDLIKGLWRGIGNLADWLWGQVKSMLSSLTDRIKDFFGIESPSKLFEEEIGKQLPYGLAIGVEKNSQKPINATKKMARDVFSSINALAGRSFDPVLAVRAAGGGGGEISSFTIAKLADEIVIREDADIDRISRALMEKVRQHARGRGVY